MVDIFQCCYIQSEKEHTKRNNLIISSFCILGYYAFIVYFGSLLSAEYEVFALERNKVNRENK